jgi:DNA-binding transcriptional ArsR family regulator
MVYYGNMSYYAYEYIHMSSESVNRLTPIFKLLGEPNRLRILFSLGLDCRPVSDIVKATGMTQTNVSFHLRLLREAGLVRPERRGAFIYYCLPDSDLLEILDHLSEWIDHKRWKTGHDKAPVAAASTKSMPR